MRITPPETTSGSNFDAAKMRQTTNYAKHTKALVFVCFAYFVVQNFQSTCSLDVTLRRRLFAGRNKQSLLLAR